MNTKKKLPNEEFRKLVEFVNEGRKDKSKKIYEDREPRKVDWKAYNFSQINSIKESLKFINEEVERCFLPPRKVGKPFDVKLYTKVVLVCEMFGLTERNAQGFIEVFGSIAGICEKLDDRVIGNAYNKKEIIQAFDFSGEDEKDAMLDLIERVEGESLRLDAGFNDRKLVRKIAEFGMLPYVYPYKSNKINGSLAWKEMYLEFFTDIIFWLKEYYLRVHCESFHSSFKRVFGIIRKIRGHSKFIQVMARIILHNRARLSYFKRVEG